MIKKAFIILDKVKIDIPYNTELVINRTKDDDLWISFRGTWYGLLTDLKEFSKQLKRHKTI